ncbi:MAG: hypothetical protein A3G20_09855 [Acidobacteria bacterium RIFCSPLOWO2_12_FULL_59_11]|nr:MAG: hypothetical protein A3G20_09855 [Acidobacteria bacterium RIFCSPLOWO2_12_FULL_59_11]
MTASMISLQGGLLCERTSFLEIISGGVAAGGFFWMVAPIRKMGLNMFAEHPKILSKFLFGRATVQDVSDLLCWVVKLQSDLRDI